MNESHLFYGYSCDTTYNCVEREAKWQAEIPRIPVRRAD